MSWSYFAPCSSWGNGTRWRWFPRAHTTWSARAGTQIWFRWCCSMLTLGWTSQRQPPVSGQAFPPDSPSLEILVEPEREFVFDPSVGTARASRWPHTTVWPPRRAGSSTMFQVCPSLLCFILLQNPYLLKIVLSRRVRIGCGFFRGSYRLQGLRCDASAEHREAVGR